MLKRLILALSILTLGLALWAPVAGADTTQVSIMQDDTELVGSGTATMNATLARMQSLGVQEVRVNLDWTNVAPDPQSLNAPAGFDATNPADYGSQGANWGPYVALADAAPMYGISVQLNLTAPGPLWAMGRGAPNAKTATHWRPNAADYFAFAYAAGREFSGQTAGVSRVSDWSVWNEPNQPGWLAPQWGRVHGRLVPVSAVSYRSLVDSGFYGLLFSGHSVRSDTILVGETAPEGRNSGGALSPVTPLPFLETLYCVDAHERPLRGASARAAGCPTQGRTSAFAHANAGLFQASGFSHHPYDFFKSPSFSWASQPDYAPLADIGRLERFLDRTFGAYAVHRRIPLYFTEYGYATNPPNPREIVSPAEQAAYLNEADYLAWSNPRVRSVAQFLLFDSAPNTQFRPGQAGYWSDTFQTGLLFHNGTPKPAYAAYRMPIWVPHPSVRRGVTMFVWGQVRPADRLPDQRLRIQWRSGHGAYRTLATVVTGPQGYYTVRVRPPASGSLRAVWTGPITQAGTTTIQTETSRSTPVRITR